jgi:regulatory protein
MKVIAKQEAKEKIRRYCAYQERAHSEVRNKLYSYGLHRSDVDEILTDLITDGFLNEERFAKAYAGGKFRMKRWGRIRIARALEAKGVSKNCVAIGLKEIDESSYEEVLAALLEDKSLTIDAENPFAMKDRLSHYAIRKGYEPEIVWKLINAMTPR